MPACITVIYPAAEDATFNLDYYMKTHMPLVLENWNRFGMSGYKVSKFVGTATGASSPYTIQALLHFDSLESFRKAAQGPPAQAIMGDIPNFSNKEPVIMVGDVVGTVGSEA